MNFSAVFPIFIIIIYLVIIFGIFFLIYKWVSKFISLKQEHNDFLREIIKKMDNK
jgi:predicted permease